MKLAILGESDADRAALQVLVDGILSIETELVNPPSTNLRLQGWPNVLRILPNFLSFLHYETSADVVVIVVDSDESVAHLSSHNRDRDCRLCQIRTAAGEVRLTPIEGRPSIKIAVGLAVPAIEAWLLCPNDTHLGEATWARRLHGERITYTKTQLKERAYGTARPSLQLETERAVDLAHELVKNLSHLERMFPDGFGSLAADIRSW